MCGSQQSKFNLLLNKLGIIRKILVMKELTISKALLMATLFNSCELSDQQLTTISFIYIHVLSQE